MQVGCNCVNRRTLVIPRPDSADVAGSNCNGGRGFRLGVEGGPAWHQKPQDKALTCVQSLSWAWELPFHFLHFARNN